MGYVALVLRFIIAIPKIIDFIKGISKSIEEHNESVRQERHDKALEEARSVLNNPNVDRAKKEKTADELLDSI
jgi:hypothetical protein